jgi:hypothetical protein
MKSKAESTTTGFLSDHDSLPITWRLTNLEMEEMLATARINTGAPGARNAGYWVSLDEKVSTRALKVAGYDATLLRKHAIVLYVRVDHTPGLARVLDTGGIYDAAGGPRQYYLQVFEDGRVFVKYQQIIGSWIAGMLDTGAQQRLVERLAKLLPPVISAEFARKGIAAPAAKRAVALAS